LHHLGSRLPSMPDGALNQVCGNTFFSLQRVDCAFQYGALNCGLHKDTGTADDVAALICNKQIILRVKIWVSQVFC